MEPRDPSSRGRVQQFGRYKKPKVNIDVKRVNVDGSIEEVGVDEAFEENVTAMFSQLYHELQRDDKVGVVEGERSDDGLGEDYDDVCFMTLILLCFVDFDV